MDPLGELPSAVQPRAILNRTCGAFQKLRRGTLFWGPCNKDPPI